MQDINPDEKQDMIKAFSSERILYTIRQIVSEQVPIAPTSIDSVYYVETEDYWKKDT